MEGVDQVSAPGVVPPADVHAPLLDLPRHLGLAQGGAPYLQADAALVELWAQRMRAAGLAGTGRLAGLVWRTDQRSSAGAHNRSRIAKSDGQLTGKGLALAGVLVSSAMLVLTVVVLGLGFLGRT